MAEKPFLHLGDLVQLNNINPEKQYRIPSVEPVFGDGQSDIREGAEDILRSELQRLGFDGACNVGYLPNIKPLGYGDNSIDTSYQCFGTPVVLKK